MRYVLLVATLLLVCACTPRDAPRADERLPDTPPVAPTTAASTLTPISLPTSAPVNPTATLLVSTQVPATNVPPTSIPPTVTPKPTAVPAINLRLVDWRKYLTTDKAFKVDTTLEHLSLNKWPYISVNNTESMGFAVLGDGIAYGDVSGDGHEEALISLFSGGTAGNLAVLLFAPGPDKPQLVATIPGYKIGGVMEAGLLKISQPQYAGFEPNCCASGLSSTNYKLTDGKLVTVSTTSEGFPEMRAPTVEKFYQFLNDKKYADAWPFLSPGYQKQQTFETWRAGYSATTSVEATDIRQRSNGTVSVLLKAAEATGKGQVAQKYHAVWSLVWDAKVGQWRLDTATVSIVTAKIAGKLQYPSSGIPALTIFAKNTDTGDIFTSETARNQSAWSITVPPGNYTVFAYLLESPNSTLAGGYSEFVKCGLKVGCPSHKLIPIKAESGKTTSGIDVSDWYAPAGAFPARP